MRALPSRTRYPCRPRRGSSVAEQRTHKPLVGSSNLPPATNPTVEHRRGLEPTTVRTWSAVARSTLTTRPGPVTRPAARRSRVNGRRHQRSRHPASGRSQPQRRAAGAQPVGAASPRARSQPRASGRSHRQGRAARTQPVGAASPRARSPPQPVGAATPGQRSQLGPAEPVGPAAPAGPVAASPPAAPAPQNQWAQPPQQGQWPPAAASRASGASSPAGPVGPAAPAGPVGPAARASGRPSAAAQPVGAGRRRRGLGRPRLGAGAMDYPVDVRYTPEARIGRYWGIPLLGFLAALPAAHPALHRARTSWALLAYPGHAADLDPGAR